MTTKLNAYLTFGGNCKEAMTFYQACIGGTLSLTTVAESTIANQMPPELQHAIMHSMLMREGEVLLMASDSMGAAPVKGNNISLSLNCSSEDEIRSFFAKLSEGGTVNNPLKIEFWGALFGHLTDQFGINWMLSYDNK